MKESAQWSPLTKSFVKGNPEESLWEKLIKGDVGDGVQTYSHLMIHLSQKVFHRACVQKEDGIVED